MRCTELFGFVQTLCPKIHGLSVLHAVVTKFQQDLLQRLPIQPTPTIPTLFSLSSTRSIGSEDSWRKLPMGKTMRCGSTSFGAIAPALKWMSGVRPTKMGNVSPASGSSTRLVKPPRFPSLRAHPACREVGIGCEREVGMHNHSRSCHGDNPSRTLISKGCGEWMSPKPTTSFASRRNSRLPTG